MSAILNRRAAKTNVAALQSLKTALTDVLRGFVHVSHSGIALLGVGFLAACVMLIARADLRLQAEQQLLGWLQQRHIVEPAPSTQAFEPEPMPEAIQRVTAASPEQLPQAQAKVTFWLSRKYRVAPEPLSVLVAEAFAVGQKAKLDPTLILAVMAVESRFNPFAQSPVGAQGLMQVLTRVHTEKYAGFGGQLAAFDPVSNLRVGVQVLKDCIERAGSIEGGLRRYVGAVTTDGSDYVNKVTAEHLRIQSVALGKPMPTVFPVYQAPLLQDAGLQVRPDGSPSVPVVDREEPLADPAPETPAVTVADTPANAS